MTVEWTAVRSAFGIWRAIREGEPLTYRSAGSDLWLYSLRRSKAKPGTAGGAGRTAVDRPAGGKLICDPVAWRQIGGYLVDGPDWKAPAAVRDQIRLWLWAAFPPPVLSTGQPYGDGMLGLVDRDLVLDGDGLLLWRRSGFQQVKDQSMLDTKLKSLYRELAEGIEPLPGPVTVPPYPYGRSEPAAFEGLLRDYVTRISDEPVVRRRLANQVRRTAIKSADLGWLDAERLGSGTPDDERVLSASAWVRAKFDKDGGRIAMGTLLAAIGERIDFYLTMNFSRSDLVFLTRIGALAGAAELEQPWLEFRLTKHGRALESEQDKRRLYLRTEGRGLLAQWRRAARLFENDELVSGPSELISMVAGERDREEPVPRRSRIDAATKLAVLTSLAVADVLGFDGPTVPRTPVPTALYAAAILDHHTRRRARNRVDDSEECLPSIDAEIGESADDWSEIDALLDWRREHPYQEPSEDGSAV
jgi:hypothetical protein